jgi:hypothetical protein
MVRDRRILFGEARESSTQRTLTRYSDLAADRASSFSSNARSNGLSVRP